ncbi:MAG: ABC transporter ATP-binding protein [Deltaproteobacteria bacterium]|nr:ABC transporter ATP-binding protein [Deltaproteobacteria bacterium]
MTTELMTNKVEIKNLSKTFHTKRGEAFAVKDFSLSIESGELVCLLGPSGCGKTTVLRSVAGLETPTSGSIEIAGQNMNGLPPQKRPVAMVFQSYALFPHMSVFENVAFGLRVRKMPHKDIQIKVEKMLELVGLHAKAKRAPNQLSGGEQQRVALARALVVNPEILLCDEPLSNLDQSLRIKMREEIKRLQKELGLTILFVTHDQEEALYLSDRIALMEKGRLVQEGTPMAFYEKPASPFVKEFLGGIKKVGNELVRVVALT